MRSLMVAMKKCKTEKIMKMEDMKKRKTEKIMKTLFF